MPKNGEKTTIGLISKEATLHVQHTLLVHLHFAVVLHDYNVKLPEIFFHCRSFSPSIGGRQHSHFCHRRYKIFICCSNKKMFPLLFISLQIFVALFLVEFRWPAAYFLFFLCFSLALYSKFVDVTINLSLMLQKTRIQKQFPPSGFVFH